MRNNLGVCMSKVNDIERLTEVINNFKAGGNAQLFIDSFKELVQLTKDEANVVCTLENLTFPSISFSELLEETDGALNGIRFKKCDMYSTIFNPRIVSNAEFCNCTFKQPLENMTLNNVNICDCWVERKYWIRLKDVDVYSSNIQGKKIDKESYIHHIIMLV